MASSADVVIEVRRYVATDLAAILELCTPEGWPALPGAADQAAAALASPDATSLVARDGQRVVGFAHLLSDGRAALLTTLRVAEGQEGRGIGTGLMVEAYRSAGDLPLAVVTEASVPFFERRVSPD